ncbi:MAG: hypothetical protein GXY83_18440 [Rhodopirellula sp.]|nr:hypothetical protein [Rhodopirellula sp.]
MPVQVPTSQGPLAISDHHVQAVVRHAHRRADLTAAALDAIGLLTKRPAVFPAGFLLEFGAVVELGVWERQGLRVFLNSDLPTFSEAADELLARVAKGSAAFDGSDAAPLSRRVFQVWMERFAWEGPDILDADFLVGDVDEDQFARVLADFVWQHRHELSRLLNNHQ